MSVTTVAWAKGLSSRQTRISRYKKYELSMSNGVVSRPQDNWSNTLAIPTLFFTTISNGMILSPPQNNGWQLRSRSNDLWFM